MRRPYFLRYNVREWGIGLSWDTGGRVLQVDFGLWGLTIPLWREHKQ